MLHAFFHVERNLQLLGVNSEITDASTGVRPFSMHFSKVGIKVVLVHSACKTRFHAKIKFFHSSTSTC